MTFNNGSSSHPAPAATAATAGPASANPVGGRLLYLDLLRCLSLLAVTVMHSSAPLLFSQDTGHLVAGMVYSTACLFCVPALLMISGALMLGDSRPMNLSKFYGKRFVKILIPLLAWSVIYYLILVLQVGTLPNVNSFLKRFFTGLWSGPLWFLYMIVGVYLMVPFLRPAFGGRATQRCLVFVGIVFGLQALNFATRLIWELELNHFLTGAIVPYYFGYFVLGHLLNSVDFKMPGGRPALAALFLACAAITTGGEFMAKGDNTMLPNTFFSYQQPLVVSMTAAIFLFFKGWQPSMTRKRARIVNELSCLSYGVFLSHILVLMLLSGQIPLIFKHGSGLDCWSVNPWVGPLLAGLAIFAGAALLTAGIKRVPGLRKIVP
jgi:surface polysaccharide O-acyltransferase-like enzyme